MLFTGWKIKRNGFNFATTLYVTDFSSRYLCLFLFLLFCLSVFLGFKVCVYMFPVILSCI